MYVKLAFAVAAHLEPEILVVDEVLAVGDVEFQKKCLGKISQVANAGRTILFVSHNMSAVERLCSRVIVLDHGRVLLISDNTTKAIQAYTGLNQQQMQPTWVNNGTHFLNEHFVLQSVQVRSVKEAQDSAAQADFIVEIVGDVLQSDASLLIAFCVYLADGQRLFWSTVHDTTDGNILPLGRIRFSAKLPSSFFNEGDHEIEVMAALHNRRFLIAPGEGPRVRFTNILSYLSPFWDRPRDGLLAPRIVWNVSVTTAC
jgi:lipopolysaccharide transport system ATP-binding protein